MHSRSGQGSVQGSGRGEATPGNAGVPSNLPRLPTPLVGRQRELSLLELLLLRADVPLLTLVGTGGIGKTRLAIRVASQLTERFEDGVFLVALAPLRDHDLVVNSINVVLGVRETTSRRPIETLISHLRYRQLLLVVDNFEHLMPAAPVLAELLTACPQLKLLVTSRAPLRLAGEHEFPVSPLGVPDDEDLAEVDLQALEGYEALQLFRQRARAVRPSFRLTARNLPIVAEICKRLDGLPLAIELAAARSKLFGPEALRERLEKRLDFLTNGTRDMPDRQQTLRKTIDWSYVLLSESQKRLFRRLGAFDTSVGLRAIKAVCGAPGDLPDLLEDLTQLVDQSLVRNLDADCPEPCVDLLETLREYALEKLAESGGEEELVRAAHARFCTQWAEELPGRADVRPEDRLRRLEAEHNNMRAALRWSIGSGDIDLSLRLAKVLAALWENNAYLAEGRRWLDEVLAITPSDDGFSARRASLCHDASLLATRQSDWQAAIALADESVRLYRVAGDGRGEAHCLLTLALIATMRGEHARAVEIHRQVVPMFERLGDKAGLARALHNFGLAQRFHNPGEALRLGRRSLELYLNAEMPRGAAQARNLIGWSLLNLGRADEARASFESSLEECWRMQARWVAGHVLQGLADAVRLQGNPPLAVRLCSASEALLRLVEAPLRQVPLEEHHRMLVSNLQSRLGALEFRAAWEEGQSMSMEAVLDELESFQPKALPRGVADRWAGLCLTPRERQVLSLVAVGLSDRQIAERLAISPTTASKHVANMLGKSGCRNRVELTRLALEQEADSPPL